MVHLTRTKFKKMKLFSFYFIGPAFYAAVKATTENGTSEKTAKVRMKIALIAIATEICIILNRRNFSSLENNFQRQSLFINGGFDGTYGC